MLTAGLSKHAQQGCLEKLNNSMTGHILRHAAYIASKKDVHVHAHTSPDVLRCPREGRLG